MMIADAVVTTAWWTSQEAGMLGAVLGIVIGGVGGGVIGGVGLLTLMHWLPNKSLALGVTAGLGLTGLTGLMIAVAAVLAGQPWHVWYPPLNVGLVLSMLGTLFSFVVLWRFRTMERQTIEADLIRGRGSASTASRRLRPVVVAAAALSVAGFLVGTALFTSIALGIGSGVATAAGEVTPTGM